MRVWTKSWTKRRRPTMYTLEQKQEAIDVYLQVNSMRKTIQLLGYPGVRLLTSLALRGHGNEPFASFLYRSRNPSPSHTRPLILSDLLPQNR